jgi:hypothetical protein
MGALWCVLSGWGLWGLGRRGSSGLEIVGIFCKTVWLARLSGGDKFDLIQQPQASADEDEDD